MSSPHPSAHEFDVIVVGSGAAGLAAAITARRLGARVLVVEKAATFGGSTALSGGGIWVPNNPALQRAGIRDDPAEIIRYLTTLTRGLVPQDRIAALVEHGPAAIEMLERSRFVRFRWVPGYSDYHPQLPGGSPGGRSIEPLPIDTRALGEDEAFQRAHTLKGPLGLWVTQRDYRRLTQVKRSWAGRWTSVVAAWRVSSNLVRRRHMAATGRALAARLWLAAREAGVEVWLNSPLESLLRHDGDVVGVVVARDGRQVEVHAQQGVVMASGGFERSLVLREKFLPPAAQTDHSSGAESNTGDGIMAGADVGAALALMEDAWWMPAVRTPTGMVPLVSERCIPNQIIVNSHGERFINEATPYVTFVHRQLEGGHHPAWFVMDGRARKRYPFARVLPGQKLPQAWFDAGIAHRADSLEALESAIGLPKGSLVGSVAAFNRGAVDGIDTEFHRGESAYDRYYGDPTLRNPCIGEITRPPFYAVRVEIGDLGTKGGLVCDARSRVLDKRGEVVRGLYASGNCSASVMGDEYAGPGATIGPAIVFGYIAARDAVEGSAPSAGI
ncbi:3-ketosteroid-delta-1-dehydrogenase [Acrocarpospora pleiomorpha]|uniref:3-oxosteroid 1-dehydrogenase n=1 Tax=Acrocarpospora pleiomorpha TaxID=90975 RepID=A0A5M3XX84_9ACTN|nr:FAD-dependent oxidoreductase [Acrocarpospora pleiomorpha]GES25764.1 3-ketosteroid-delta-1-dehydrogenase [Acrocarpospora pleiomorpha]